MSEYNRTNFDTAQQTIYDDGLPSGSTTRSSHRSAHTNVKDSAVFLEDLAAVTASGSATYTASLAYDPGVAYASPNRFYLVKFTSANTGPSTINFNSRGAKSIVKNANQDLVPGDIKAGSVYLLFWDGTNFQISGKQNDSGIYDLSYTLSAAQVTNSFSSPVTILAAPGTGYMWFPIGHTIGVLNYGSAAFATNTNSAVGWTTSTTWLANNFSNLLTQTADYVQILYNSITNNLQPYATYANQPFIFYTPTGNPTGGTGSQVTINMSYRLIKLP